MIFKVSDFPAPLAPEQDLGVPGEQREAHVAQDDLLVERQRDVIEHDRRRALLGQDLFGRQAGGLVAVHSIPNS